MIPANKLQEIATAIKSWATPTEEGSPELGPRDYLQLLGGVFLFLILLYFIIL